MGSVPRASASSKMPITCPNSSSAVRPAATSAGSRRAYIRANAQTTSARSAARWSATRSSSSRRSRSFPSARPLTTLMIGMLPPYGAYTRRARGRRQGPRPLVAVGDHAHGHFQRFVDRDRLRDLAEEQRPHDDPVGRNDDAKRPTRLAQAPARGEQGPDAGAVDEADRREVDEH